MRETGEEKEHRKLDLPSWHWGTAICHLSLVAFSLTLLWQPLFAGEAFFWGTPLLQFIPWQQLAADMWRSGHVPLWNHLVGCGAPLAANYQTAAFYPLNALYLLTQAEVALTWTVALHLALTGWGMYRWGRARQLDRFPALVGALALEGCGFLVGRAALFPSIAVTFPWIPIWLWRVEVLVQSGRLGAASRAKALRDALWLGFTLGMGLLAGHAQTAAYGGVLVAAYTAFRITQDTRMANRKTAGRKQERAGQGQKRKNTRGALHRACRISCPMLLSLMLGLGLAAVQLLPTTELLALSQRSAGVSAGSAMTYSFWPWRIITLVAPTFFGTPHEGNYWGYGAHWEDATYIGLLPLLLAVSTVIRALTRRRSSLSNKGRMPGTASSTGELDRSLSLFWAVSIVFTLLLALGNNTPVFPLLFRHVPGFDLFQAPTRWLALTTLALAALAAMGAQRWPRGRRAHQRQALGASIGGALLIGGMTAPRLIPDIPTTFGPATVRLGIVLLATSTLSLLRKCRRKAHKQEATWWQIGVGLFIALDLLSIGWALIPTVDRSLYKGITKTAKILHNDREQVRVYWPSDPMHKDQTYDAQYRVKFDYLTFDDFGPQSAIYWRGMREDQLPNANILDRIASTNNFDPLLVGEHSDMIEAAVDTPGILEALGITHVVSDAPWPGGQEIHTGDSATLYRLPGALGRAWLVPHAKELPSDQILPAMQVSSFDPTDTVLLEEGAARGRVGAEGSAANHDLANSRLTLREGPNRVRIDVVLEAPGYLVLTDTWYPGWRATVDGEPATLLRANHAFRTVRLSAGERTIEMIYRPVSFLVGGAISLLTVVMLGLGLVLSRKERP